MKIERAKYIGYLWYSNSSAPEVYYGDKELELVLEDSDNPFIIEGLLWNSEKNVSIHVYYLEGHYTKRERAVKEEWLNRNDDRHTKVEYVAHRISKVKKLIFIQCWDLDHCHDNGCCDMPVYVPTELLFCGFN